MTDCCLLLRWGFAALANAPYGVLLRWILLLLCQSRHGRRPGPQKDNNSSTTKELLLWGGASLRSPLACGVLLPGYSNTGSTTLQHNKRAASLGWGFAPLANAPYGVLLRWILLLLPGYPNSGPFAGLLEQRTFAGLPEQRTFAGLPEQRTFAGLLPLLLRPLPSASVGFPVPQLFIIVPFYKY